MRKAPDGQPVVRIVDVSRRIAAGMSVYPGDPEPWSFRYADGPARASLVTLGTHCGTHVDPPLHFLAGGAGVDELDLAVLCGPARVAEVTGVVDAPELGRLGLDDGVERLLLRGCAGLTEAAARLLRRAGVRLLGVDSLSVDAGPGPDYPAHRVLLAEQPAIVVVEGLDLAAAEPGDWELYCLPLKLAGGDGGPARAVLVRRPG